MLYANSAVLSCNSTYRLRYWNYEELIKCCCSHDELQQYLPFTVLKPDASFEHYTDLKQLQQYLPFTVLKRFFWRLVSIGRSPSCNSTYRLRYWNRAATRRVLLSLMLRCNSTYRLRYWNLKWSFSTLQNGIKGCNSTYRLRYWNLFVCVIILNEENFTVATVLTVYGIETMATASLVITSAGCNSTYRLRYWNLLNVRSLT